jgi:D-alanyl-D-alanine carboxypeptidase
VQPVAWERSRVLRGIGALAAGAIALGTFAQPAAAAAAPPSVSPSLARRLTAVVAQQLRTKHFPGAVVAVQRAGRKPWTVAQGVANLETRAPMRTDEHVRIGSVTKAFVTTAVLQLAQERRLSLEDPISRYVARVPNGDRITLRELGNMTSGIADFFANQQFSIEYLTGETFTPDHMLELGFALPPLFAPDTAWAYSNTNTVLLGRVIERITGQPLTVALQRRIFTPLGLHGTSLPSASALPRPFPNGYTNQTINGRLGDATFATPTATWAAGGIVSTVADLLRAAPLFGTGRPLLRTAAQRQRPRWVRFPPNSRIQRYGFGVFDFDGWIGHNGGIPGYTTIDWYLPSQRLSLVVTVNSDIHAGPRRADYAYEPASEIAHELTKLLSPGNVAPSAVKVGGTPVTAVD